MVEFVCCQFGRTALLLTAMQGNVDVVQLLLKHGANANDTNFVCIIDVFLLPFITSVAHKMTMIPCFSVLLGVLVLLLFLG